jgi:hypothetical protein
MSGAARAIKKPLKKVEKKLKDEILDPVINTVEGVAKAMGDDPLTAIATIGAAATGQTWAIPLINGASTVAKGGDLGDVAKSIAISAIAPAAVGKVSAVATNAITNLGVSAGASTAIGSVIGKTVVSAATGADLKTALIGGVSGEIAKTSTKYLKEAVPNFDKLSESQQNSVNKAVTTFIESGGNVNEGILAGVANSLTDNINALSPKTAQFNEAIIDATTAGLQGRDAGVAFIGSLNRQGAETLGSKVQTYFDDRAQAKSDELREASYDMPDAAPAGETVYVGSTGASYDASADPEEAMGEKPVPLTEAEKADIESRTVYIGPTGASYTAGEQYAALDSGSMTDAGDGSGLSLAELKSLSLDELLALESDGSESAAIEIRRRTDEENVQDLAAFEDAESLEDLQTTAEPVAAQAAQAESDRLREASLDQPEPIKTAEEELEDLDINPRLDPIYGEFRTDREREVDLPDYLFEGTGEEFYEPGRGIGGMGIPALSQGNNYGVNPITSTAFAKEIAQYGKDFKRGTEQTLDNYLTGVEAAALTMGNEELTAWAKEARSKFDLEGVSATQEFIKQGEGANYDWTKLDNAIVEQGANLIAAVTGRFAFAAAGTAVAGPAGGVVGGLGGPAIVEMMQIIGPIAMAQAKKNGREAPNGSDWAFATTGSAVSGALNAVPFTGKGAFKTFGSATKEFFAEAVQETTEEYFSTASKILDSEAFKALSKNIKTFIGAGLIGGGTVTTFESTADAAKYVSDKVTGVRTGKEKPFSGSGVYNQQVLGEPVTKRGTGLINQVDRSLDEYAFQGPNTAEQDIAALGLPRDLTPTTDQQLEDATIGKILDTTTTDQQLEDATIGKILDTTTTDQQLEDATIGEILDTTTTDQQLEDATIGKILDTTTTDQQLEQPAIGEILDTTTTDQQLEDATIGKILDTTTTDQQLEDATIGEILDTTTTDQQLEQPAIGEILDTTTTDQQLEQPAIGEILDTTTTDQQLEQPAIGEILDTTTTDQQLEQPAIGEILDTTTTDQQLEQPAIGEILDTTTTDQQLEDAIIGEILDTTTTDQQLEQPAIGEILDTTTTDQQLEDAIIGEILDTTTTDQQLEQPAIGEILDTTTTDQQLEQPAIGEILDTTTTDQQLEQPAPLSKREVFNSIMSSKLEANRNLGNIFTGLTGKPPTIENVANTPNDTWKSIFSKAETGRILGRGEVMSYESMLEAPTTGVTFDETTTQSEFDFDVTPAGEFVGAPIRTTPELDIDSLTGTQLETPSQGEFDFDVTPELAEAVTQITGGNINEVTSKDVDKVTDTLAAIQTAVDPKITSKTNIDPKIIPETNIDPKITPETNINAFINSIVNTNIEPPEEVVEEEKKDEEQATSGMGTIFRTDPVLADIDYLYDFSSIFATPQQAQQYQTARDFTQDYSNFDTPMLSDPENINVDPSIDYLSVDEDENLAMLGADEDVDDYTTELLQLIRGA